MSQPEATPKPAARTANPAERGRRIRIGVVVGVVVLVASYGVGRIQGKLASDAAEQRVEQSKAETARATTEFDAQRDRVLQLEARRRLELALLALGEQNFGIAKAHVAKAAVLLHRAAGNPGLDALAKQLDALKLDSGDLARSRAELGRLIRAFDGALPPAEP
jgi:hypothetical protein